MATARARTRPRARNARLAYVISQRWVASLLVRVIALCTVVVAGVCVAIVVGLERLPRREERTLLVLAMIASAVAALLYLPTRELLDRFARSFRREERGQDPAILRSFAGRLTRALPLDELLLQLAEALRRGLTLEAAEIWTGSAGLLERTVSDPERGPGTLILSPAEEKVVARASVSGSAWVDVWLPQLLADRQDAVLRVAPLAHAGELLGLIVVERGPTAGQFGEEEERLVAELARHVSLALRNVRLDSELRASLAELQRQAEELRASRARVVAAADAERRRIERDLHDGAQQHLASLAVHLRLARDLTETSPAEASALLKELSVEVQDAVTKLRDLAHGIYPPLLLDRGIADALAAAATWSPARAQIEAGTIGRYPAEVEATIYFCCLEALQNVAKHAGPDPRVTIRIREEQGRVVFEVADTGAGFEPERQPRGAGITNMGDRLGAIGGSLGIESSPGRGTCVRGTIPLAR